MTNFSTILRPTSVLLVAGSLLASAAPALAKELVTGNDSQEQPADRDQSTRRFCAARTITGDDAVTGTMLSRKTCKTRAQWEKAGVQIDAK